VALLRAQRWPFKFRLLKLDQKLAEDEKKIVSTVKEIETVQKTVACLKMAGKDGQIMGSAPPVVFICREVFCACRSTFTPLKAFKRVWLGNPILLAAQERFT